MKNSPIWTGSPGGNCAFGQSRVFATRAAGISPAFGPSTIPPAKPPKIPTPSRAKIAPLPIKMVPSDPLATARLPAGIHGVDMASLASGIGFRHSSKLDFAKPELNATESIRALRARSPRLEAVFHSPTEIRSLRNLPRQGQCSRPTSSTRFPRLSPVRSILASRPLSFWDWGRSAALTRYRIPTRTRLSRLSPSLPFRTIGPSGSKRSAKPG